MWPYLCLQFACTITRASRDSLSGRNKRSMSFSLSSSSSLSRPYISWHLLLYIWIYASPCSTPKRQHRTTYNLRDRKPVISLYSTIIRGPYTRAQTLRQTATQTVPDPFSTPSFVRQPVRNSARCLSRVTLASKVRKLTADDDYPKKINFPPPSPCQRYSHNSGNVGSGACAT